MSIPFEHNPVAGVSLLSGVSGSVDQSRDSLMSCSRICGLTGSVVPATGPAPGVGVCPPEPVISPPYALAAALPATNALPLASIRCRITASLRANATFALRMPVRFATRIAQLFSNEPLTGRVKMTLAAS